MWTYNNLRIYVQDEEASASQIIARLQPVGAKTVLHIFGDETLIYRFNAKIVGPTNLDTLFAMLNDGTAYTLSGWDFNESLYLSKLSYKRNNNSYQTIDTDQPCETPVYDVSMELMID